jgi:hypothetical protein
LCCLLSQAFFSLVLLLNQRWSPPLRLQVSDCSTFRIMCHVPNTVEPRLSELRLTETRVNRNACQALQFPELPAARHLWASPRQFVTKSWRVRTSGKLTCVCVCASYSAVLTFCVTVIANSVSYTITCCNNNWTEIGGCETNWKWRDLAKCRGGFRYWHINGFRLGKIEIETRRTLV